MEEPNQDQAVPFDPETDPETDEQEGPSQRVAEVLAGLAEADFDPAEFLELSTYCLDQVLACADEALQADSTEDDRIGYVEGIVKIQMALQVLDSVDFDFYGEDADADEDGDLEDELTA
jgi:hypothetical protein